MAELVLEIASDETGEEKNKVSLIHGRRDSRRDIPLLCNGRRGK